MKILQLSKKFPYPPIDGETIATTQLAKGMAAQGCDLDLVAFNTVKHKGAVDNLPDDCPYRSIVPIALDNRVRPVPALKNLLFSRQSYHIERFISPEFEDQVVRHLKECRYDVVQLETAYMAPYISAVRENSDAVVVLRSHNVEHEIWERLTENEKNPVKRAYLDILTKRLKNYELEQLDCYDAMLSISMKDDEVFRGLGYNGVSHFVPISLDLKGYVGSELDAENISLSFIGSLDWFPNIEGVDWFLENVDLGKLRVGPNPVELHVAGRNPPEHVRKDLPVGVTVHGEVDSAIDFINAHPVMIVPLFSGSGMRTKILEAMALERVVITTTLGLEGIEAIDGKEVLIADTPEQFHEKIQWCIDNPAAVREMGKAGRELMLREFDTASIAARLVRFYKDLLSAHQAEACVGG